MSSYCSGRVELGILVGYLLTTFEGNDLNYLNTNATPLKHDRALNLTIFIDVGDIRLRELFCQLDCEEKPIKNCRSHPSLGSASACL